MLGVFFFILLFVEGSTDGMCLGNEHSWYQWDGFRFRFIFTYSYSFSYFRVWTNDARMVLNFVMCWPHVVSNCGENCIPISCHSKNSRQSHWIRLCSFAAASVSFLPSFLSIHWILHTLVFKIIWFLYSFYLLFRLNTKLIQLNHLLAHFHHSFTLSFFQYDFV